MSKIDAITTMQLDGYLNKLADVVGEEYQVTFIARNIKRPHADITLSNDRSDKMRKFILGMDVEKAEFMTPTEKQLRNQLIERTHAWIRDCGLDVQDVEAFVDRELMQLCKAHAEAVAVEARENELFRYFTQTVGDPKTPIRSKYVSIADAYLKTRYDELQVQRDKLTGE